MIIKENQELILENVLSYRGKVTQQQMQEEMIKIGKVLQELGVKRNGSVITANYAVEETNRGQITDIEILVPLEKKCELPVGYRLKPMIKIVNALSARHEGYPDAIHKTVKELNEYILYNNKQVITATYNVIVKDAINKDELNKMIIDIYVGCNPCIV